MFWIKSCMYLCMSPSLEACIEVSIWIRTLLSAVLQCCPYPKTKNKTSLYFAKVHWDGVNVLFAFHSWVTHPWKWRSPSVLQFCKAAYRLFIGRAVKNCLPRSFKLAFCQTVPRPLSCSVVVKIWIPPLKRWDLLSHALTICKNVFGSFQMPRQRQETRKGHIRESASKHSTKSSSPQVEYQTDDGRANFIHLPQRPSFPKLAARLCEFFFPRQNRS